MREIDGRGLSREPRRAATAAPLLLLAVALLAPGCGGTEESSNTLPDNAGGGVFVDPGCVDFLPDSNPVPGEVTIRETASSGCDVLELELVVTDVQDLFAADFVLTFSNAVLSYARHSTDGSILSSDGSQLDIQLQSSTAGQLAMTITRVQSSSGAIDAIGQHRLVRLYFNRTAGAGATSPLVFSSARFFDIQPSEIAGIDWRGGTVTVN